MGAKQSTLSCTKSKWMVIKDVIDRKTTEATGSKTR